MKPNQQIIAMHSSPRSLKELLHLMISNAKPVANQHNTHIVSEVQQEIPLGSSSQAAIAIMSDLLTTIIANSKNGDIHIHADRYKDVVIIQIEERNNYNGYALSFSVDSMAHEAFSVGGHISIKDPNRRTTVISFSFPAALLVA